MIFVYYILLFLLLIAASPLTIVLPKARAGLSQKLGFISNKLKISLPHKPRIWFHAVSVGEFNAVYPLLLALRSKYPQYLICVSTTTATGQKLAQEKTGDWACVFYFPFDLPWATAAWLDLIRPSLVAVVETEIWPGFTYACVQRQIPIIVLNGRISPRSFKRYCLLKPFFGAIFRKFSAIAAQNDSEAEKYQILGGHELPVTVCGNIKCDGISPISQEYQNKLKELLNVQKEDFVIVGGSTHEGEEVALLKYLAAFPKFTRLVIAPRHPERYKRVAQLIRSFDFRVRFYSQQESFEKDKDVFLLDTIGQLSACYAIASAAFVGGTLAPIGGHNLLEPYAYSVPVLCGPHLEKTKDLAQNLKANKALLVVNSEQQLTEGLQSLRKDPALRLALGSNGQRWLVQNQGAVIRTLALIETVLNRTASTKWTTRSDNDTILLSKKL